MSKPDVHAALEAIAVLQAEKAHLVAHLTKLHLAVFSHTVLKHESTDEVWRASFEHLMLAMSEARTAIKQAGGPVS